MRDHGRRMEYLHPMKQQTPNQMLPTSGPTSGTMQTTVGAGAVGDDPEHRAELDVFRLYEPQHEVKDRREETELDGKDAGVRRMVRGRLMLCATSPRTSCNLGSDDGRPAGLNAHEVPHALDEGLEHAEDEVEHERAGQFAVGGGRAAKKRGALNITRRMVW